jgi:hypothetical protein
MRKDVGNKKKCKFVYLRLDTFKFLAGYRYIYKKNSLVIDLDLKSVADPKFFPPHPGFLSRIMIFTHPGSNNSTRIVCNFFKHSLLFLFLDPGSGMGKSHESWGGGGNPKMFIPHGKILGTPLSVTSLHFDNSPM